MCILGLSLAKVGRSRFPIVIVNNRDEYLHRPTMPFTIDPASGVACFRDGLAGGTWMGVNLRTGAFAALTNSRDMYGGRRGAESRGHLITRFLDESERAAHPPPHDAAHNGALYDGYNFVSCGDLRRVASGAERLLYTTNRCRAGKTADDGGVPVKAQPLDHGNVHVVSNTHLDNWREPKTRYLRDTLSSLMGADKTQELSADELVAELGKLLCSRSCDTCLVENGACEDHELDVHAHEGAEARYARAVDIFDAGVTDGNGTHATRTQSVVIVEHLSDAHTSRTDSTEVISAPAAEGDTQQFRIHYFVRDVSSVDSFGSWNHSYVGMSLDHLTAKARGEADADQSPSTHVAEAATA